MFNRFRARTRRLAEQVRNFFSRVLHGICPCLGDLPAAEEASFVLIQDVKRWLETGDSMKLHLAHRIRGLCRHIVLKGWPGLLCIAAIPTSYALGWSLASNAAQHFRWAGALLQVAGIGTVAYGLSQTRKLFDLPSVGAGFDDWVKGVSDAVSGPRTITGSIQSVVPGIRQSAAGGVEYKRPGADAPTKERIQALQDGQDKLREDLANLRSDLNDKFQTTKEELSEESKMRKEADNRVKELIREASIGGIHLETIGILWLMFGVLFASVPQTFAFLSTLPNPS